MKREIGTDDNLVQQKSIKAESAKKKAIIVGLICFPVGVIFGLFCLFGVIGASENWAAWAIFLGVACFCCFIALVGLSSFIAALIIKSGFRKAMGWIILGNVAWLAIGCIIFFNINQYIWGETLGVDIAFICIFVFIVLGPFIGWRLLTHRRHPKLTKKSNDA